MHNATVTIPEGSYIRLVVAGEEDTPVDLTASAQDLLRLGLDAAGEKPSSEATVEFASIEASDDIAYSLDGDALDAETALDAIGVAVVAALREALDRIKDAAEQ